MREPAWRTDSCRLQSVVRWAATATSLVLLSCADGAGFGQAGLVGATASNAYRSAYASQPGFKSFANADDGSWGWVSGRGTAQQAVTDALARCSRHSTTCKTYAIDDVVVGGLVPSQIDRAIAQIEAQGSAGRPRVVRAETPATGALPTNVPPIGPQASVPTPPATPRPPLGTSSAASSSVAPPNPASPPALADLTQNRGIVRYIQTSLRILGLDPGRFDGVADAKTKIAIRAFQSSRNLPASDVITVDTFEQIVSAADDVGPVAQPTNVVAAIVGIRNYEDRAPDVLFADNDAAAVEKFVSDTLKADRRNILRLQSGRGSKGELEEIFGSDRAAEGRLYRLVRAQTQPSNVDVLVYVSSHGVSRVTESDNLRDRRGPVAEQYLLPKDGDPENPQINAYSLQLLRRNLLALNARSVTLILEACFSGQSDGGPVQKDVSLINTVINLPPDRTDARGITILAASQFNETARWDRDAKQGRFTKHLLEGLSGLADARPYGNADGSITLGEVRAYLAEAMRHDARMEFRNQKPDLLGDDRQILVVLR